MTEAEFNINLSNFYNQYPQLIDQLDPYEKGSWVENKTTHFKNRYPGVWNDKLALKEFNTIKQVILKLLK